MPRGRPQKWSPRLAEVVVEAVRGGATLKAAAKQAGIGHGTLVRLLQASRRAKPGTEIAKLAEQVELARKGSTIATLRRAPPKEEPQEPPKLIDFVPATSPWLSRPDHLAKACDVFDEAMRKRVRACIAMPPQVGKSTIELHALALKLRFWARSRNALVTHSIKFSRSQSRWCQEYALAAGVELDTRMSGVEEFWTRPGGGLVATGIGGSLLGHAVDGLLSIDDPYSGPKQAFSVAYRNFVNDWTCGVAKSRVHPGASIVAVHSRWDEKDLIGVLVKEEGFDYVELPAIIDEGTKNERSMWEKGRPLEFLRAQRVSVGPLFWACQWQQRPHKRGGRVFERMHRVARLPALGTVPYRISIGGDWAYTTKTGSHMNAAVVLLEMAVPVELDGVARIARLLHVAEVVEEQAEFEVFVDQHLQPLRQRWMNPTVHTHLGPAEGGVESTLKARGIPVVVYPAIDKVARSQPCAAAVSRKAGTKGGEIVVLDGQPWSRRFIDQVEDFTGLGDGDDSVMALVSAFEPFKDSGEVEVHDDVVQSDSGRLDGVF